MAIRDQKDAATAHLLEDPVPATKKLLNAAFPEEGKAPCMSCSETFPANTMYAVTDDSEEPPTDMHFCKNCWIQRDLGSLYPQAKSPS